MSQDFWRTAGRTVVFETPVFSLRRDRKHRPGLPDRTHDFYVIEAVDWVNVIPLTPDEEVVLLAHYRHGTDEVRLEIPGGMVDPEDASPREAAARELLEETGFQAPELVELGFVHPNPALQANRCYTYLARDAVRAGDPRPDENEDLEVVRYPRREIERLFREGRITHALVAAAFFWLSQFESGG